MKVVEQRKVYYPKQKRFPTSVSIGIRLSIEDLSIIEKSAQEAQESISEHVRRCIHFMHQHAIINA